MGQEGSRVRGIESREGRQQKAEAAQLCAQVTVLQGTWRWGAPSPGQDSSTLRLALWLPGIPPLTAVVRALTSVRRQKLPRIPSHTSSSQCTHSTCSGRSQPSRRRSHGDSCRHRKHVWSRPNLGWPCHRRRRVWR